jgi:hypothetical protein
MSKNLENYFGSWQPDMNAYTKTISSPKNIQIIFLFQSSHPIEALKPKNNKNPIDQKSHSWAPLRKGSRGSPRLFIMFFKPIIIVLKDVGIQTIFISLTLVRPNSQFLDH